MTLPNNNDLLQRSIKIGVLVLFGSASITYLLLDYKGRHQQEIETLTHSAVVTKEDTVVEAGVTQAEIIDEAARILEEKKATQPVLFDYVQVVESCGAYYEGDCLVARAGPGADYPVVASLRNHIILQVDGKITREGREWYKIVFNEWLRYPERVSGDWYVASDYVEILQNEGELTTKDHGTASTTKRIEVDRSAQTLKAYDGDELFMEATISTGLALTPTPRGTFTVFKKMPSRYMQGPLPGFSADDYYDLPGVPWNLYFTEGGAVIHGTYWHNKFGQPYSHGCVNMDPDMAKKLYDWAQLGTKVVIQ